MFISAVVNFASTGFAVAAFVNNPHPAFAGIAVFNFGVGLLCAIRSND